MAYADDILEPVAESKRDKFASKLQEFNEREWNRDNFVDHLQDVRNVIDTVDELLTEVQADIERLQGTPDRKSKIQRITEDYGEDQLEQFQNQSLSSGYSPTLKPIADAYAELADKQRRANAWVSYKYELASLALMKLQSIAVGYRQDVISGDVSTALEEIVEEWMEPALDAQRKDIMLEVERRFAGLERSEEASPSEESDSDGGEDLTKRERVEKLLEENPDMSTSTIKTVMGSDAPSDATISRARSEVED